MSAPNLKNRAFIAANWQAMSDREMAQALGVAPSTVASARKRMGLKRETNYLKDTHGDQLLSMYLQGMRICDMAAAIGANRDTVSDVMLTMCKRDIGLRIRRERAVRLRKLTKVVKRRSPTALRKHAGPKRPKAQRPLMSAKRYGALFDDVNERFLMLMKRRQEVKELLLQAASIPTNDGTDENVVGHLLPHYKDLNGAVLKLSRCVGQ
jgi:plasmid maintenance system antidote protein VapI